MTEMHYFPMKLRAVKTGRGNSSPEADGFSSPTSCRKDVATDSRMALVGQVHERHAEAAMF